MEMRFSILTIFFFGRPVDLSSACESWLRVWVYFSFEKQKILRLTRLLCFSTSFLFVEYDNFVFSLGFLFFTTWNLIRFSCSASLHPWFFVCLRITRKSTKFGAKVDANFCKGILQFMEDGRSVCEPKCK